MTRKQEQQPSNQALIGTLMTQNDWPKSLDDFALCRLIKESDLDPQLNKDQWVALLAERNSQGQMLLQVILETAANRRNTATACKFCNMLLSVITQLPLEQQTLLFDVINQDKQLLMNILALPNELREAWCELITKQAPELLGSWFVRAQAAVMKKAISNDSAIPVSILRCLPGLPPNDLMQIMLTCAEASNLQNPSNVLFNLFKWVYTNKNIFSDENVIISWYQLLTQQWNAIQDLRQENNPVKDVLLHTAWQKTLKFDELQTLKKLLLDQYAQSVSENEKKSIEAQRRFNSEVQQSC